MISVFSWNLTILKNIVVLLFKETGAPVVNTINKSMKKATLSKLITGCLLLSPFVFTSCYKEKDPPVGIVKVMDANGKGVSGCTVEYETSGTKTGIIKGKATTSSNGQATLQDFDLPNISTNSKDVTVAILDIYAHKDSLEGYGILKLVMGETTETTITVK
jgi:hypothetical protein